MCVFRHINRHRRFASSGSSERHKAVGQELALTRCFWQGAGAAGIEIVVTLLTVKLLIPMSGMEQSVPEVDLLLSV